MHDLDRTQLEVGAEEYEGEYESDMEMEDEFASETIGVGEYEGLFSEAEEMELASELLEVTNEDDLDQFLGKWIRRAKHKIGRFIPRPIMNRVGGFLKGAVKKALPGLAAAAGTALGGPFGGMVAGRLAPMAGKYLGLELEGLSGEDQEFEAARGLVRFGNAAIQQAASAPPTASPQAVAQQAVAAAARQHAPGFLRNGSSGSANSIPGSRQRTGRWIRRGSKIILLGV